MEPLLTIAIPTYNRCTYLERSLYYLKDQVNEASDRVEIIISDNCSNDATSEIVNKYKKQGIAISYIKNETNIGVDRNIVQCYKQAKGKFVWIMGDDDYLIPGVLYQIINLLEKNAAIGVCYINSKWLMRPEDYKPSAVSAINCSIEKDNIAFLNKVHYWLTFLTGNIINKELIAGLNINIEKYIGTNLVQLGWTIPAVLNGTQNIIIEDQLLICHANNSGGYNLIKVFAHNFNGIMNDFIKIGADVRLKTIINNKLLESFFIGFFKNSTAFKDSTFKFLFRMALVYWKYPVFWKKYVFNLK